MVRAVPADVLEKIVARIPVGRLGRRVDIARGVAFLTADEAEFITGSTLSINGGQHMPGSAGRASQGTCGRWSAGGHASDRPNRVVSAMSKGQRQEDMP